ncbi:MAG TPA: hypothetical protein VGC11_14650 [Acidimicrobiia bacterium]
MPPAPLSIAASLAAASLAGALHLAVDDTPFAAESAALVAMGMVVLSVTSIAGVLLSRGRWSRPVAAGVAAGWIALASSSDPSWLSLATIGLAAAALGGTLGPWLGRWLRHRPSTDGPPPAAVIALLLLLATPAMVAVTSPGGISAAGWALAGWSLALALGLARTVPGALIGLRVIHPLASIGAGITAGAAAAVALGVLGGAAAVAGWRREVAVALAPALVRRSDAMRIPPELAPPDVLDAAGLDDLGRRRDAG